MNAHIFPAMKYSTFEELPVWKASSEFALKVFEFTNKADLRGLGDIKNQIERAALWISNNIAEGFERGHVERAPKKKAPPTP